MILNDEASEGFAKILDLGVAATGSELEGTTTLFGTPSYMAPEQISGDRIDGRTDLYALGVTLFEMLTGQLPFRGSTGEYVLAQHLTKPPPRLVDVAPKLPARDELQALLDTCLAKDPARRVRDAATLAKQIEALEPVVRAAPSGAVAPRVPSRAPEPVAEAPSPAPVPATRGLARWLIAGLVLLAAAAAYFVVRALGLT